MNSTMRIKRKLPDAPEPTWPAYRKPEVISPPPGAKVIKIPCAYRSSPAPIPKPKKKTKKEQAIARKAPIQHQSLTYDQRKWTEQRINVLIDLYNRGLSYPEIGEEMGINGHTAGTMVSKLRNLGRITKVRCTSNWPEEQDRLVIDLYNKGARYVDIAKALGKSESTIQRRIDFLKSVGELGERKALRCKKQQE